MIHTDACEGAWNAGKREDAPIRLIRTNDVRRSMRHSLDGRSKSQGDLAEPRNSMHRKHGCIAHWVLRHHEHGETGHVRSLPKRIVKHAEAHPEATPLCVRAACFTSDTVRQSTRQLSRLARSGALMRICRGRLHASRRKPVSAFVRPVSARLFAALVYFVGRNHRAMRRRGGQPARTDHAEPGSCGLSDLGFQPSSAFRVIRCEIAPRTVLETRGTAPQGRRHRPCPGMARSGRGRGPDWRRSCQCLMKRTATNPQPHGPSCRTGWRCP